VVQASITDPNGNVEQKSFDTNGFVTADSYAVGQSYEETTTYTRDNNTELINSKTDPLERETKYIYDSLGNLLSVTPLFGTQQAVTTSYTYTPAFSEIASITDPLGPHPRQLGQSDQHHRSACPSGHSRPQFRGSSDLDRGRPGRHDAVCVQLLRRPKPGD